MSLRYANFQPVKPKKGRDSIGGLLAVAAVCGMIVSRKTGATDELELSTGKAGFFLSRSVVSDADFKTALEQQELYPDKNEFELPFKVDGSVQAEDFQEVWVEGSALLDASMDVSTTVRAPVTSAAGKFAELTDSEAQECLGFVVLNEAARNGGGGRRFLIQIARSGKNIPAA